MNSGSFETTLDQINQLRYQQPFSRRAEMESDPVLAEDLRYASQIAQDIKNEGGLALVVGGFVRDTVLSDIRGEQFISKDIDIEVYNMPFKDLEYYLQRYGKVNLVGASFGIIKLTNSQTHSTLDFSIPRKDSKVDLGHKGFVVTGDPTMSVRDAAARRDLTINALAMDPLTGEVIDEYGGIADLQNGILRATDAGLFTDDPLRSLRVMQFAGRYGFTVDADTVELCRSLDLSELPRERMWDEWAKLLLRSPRPSVGLEAAKQLGILEQLHPELEVLESIDQEPEWHPEGDVWIHTKNVVDAAARITQVEHLSEQDALIVLLGALCHDLGKASTTQLAEKHGVMRLTAHGHEQASVEPARCFLEGIYCHQDIIAKVLPIIREHLFHEHSKEPSDKSLHRFAHRLRPASIYLWDLVARADANGRGEEFMSRTPSHKVYLRSTELGVEHKPAQMIVNGQDLIDYLGLKPGVLFGHILRALYEAQIEGAFTSIERGIAYCVDNDIVQKSIDLL